MNKQEKIHRGALQLQGMYACRDLTLAELWLYNLIQSEQREAGVGFKNREMQFVNIGGERSVGFEDTDLERVRDGGVITHCHPVGGTLSLADIDLASIANLHEMRAVLPDGRVHSIVLPDGGWGPEAAFRKKNREWVKGHRYFRKYVELHCEAGTRLYAANYEFEPWLWLEFCDEFGGTFSVRYIEKQKMPLLEYELDKLQARMEQVDVVPR